MVYTFDPSLMDWSHIAQAAVAAAGKVEEIPLLDAPLGEFLADFGAFALELEINWSLAFDEMIRIGREVEEATPSIRDLQANVIDLVAIQQESAFFMYGLEAAVEANRQHMEDTWGEVEIQWHDWAMDEVERRLERHKAELEQDRSFWGRVWDIFTDPVGETVDFWGDVFSGIGAWFEDNLFPWLESRAEGVVGVAGRILEKVW